MCNFADCTHINACDLADRAYASLFDLAGRSPLSACNLAGCVGVSGMRPCLLRFSAITTVPSRYKSGRVQLTRLQQFRLQIHTDSSACKYVPANMPGKCAAILNAISEDSMQIREGTRATTWHSIAHPRPSRASECGRVLARSFLYYCCASITHLYALYASTLHALL